MSKIVRRKRRFGPIAYYPYPLQCFIKRTWRKRRVGGSSRTATPATTFGHHDTAGGDQLFYDDLDVDNFFYDTSFLPSSSSDESDEVGEREEPQMFDWLDQKLLTFDLNSGGKGEPSTTAGHEEVDPSQSSFDDDPENHIKMIEVTPNLNLIILDPSDTNRIAIIEGKATIELIHGQAALNGHKLERGKPVKIALGMSEHVLFVSFPRDNGIDKNQTSKSSMDAAIKDLDLKDVHLTKEIMDELSHYSGDVTILVAKRSSSNQLDWMESQLFNAESIYTRSSEWFHIGYVKENNPVPESWSSQITRVSSRLTEQSIVVVAGPKNAGKSSLIRHVINSSLKQWPTGIIFVDADPGQTEFSPPGQLTAALVTEPFLSPTYANVIRAVQDPNVIIAASSTGGISVAEDPDLYLAAFLAIWTKVSAELSENGPRPIFVNTMGWVTGIGLDLLVNMINLTKLDTLIEIKVERRPERLGMNSSRASEVDDEKVDLSPHQVASMFGWSSSPIFSLHRDLDYEYVQLSAPAPHGARSSRFTKLSRKLATLAYFSTVPEVMFKPLHEVTPKTLSLSGLFLSVVHGHGLPKHLVLAAVESSVVQLCRLSEDQIRASSQEMSSSNSEVTSSTADGPNVLHKLDSNQLLGCAYVVAVDTASNCLKLVTPLSSEVLSKVNLVVRPTGVHLPEELVREQLAWNHGLPLPSYINCER